MTTGHNITRESRLRTGHNIMTRGHNITEEGCLISERNITWGGRNITGCSESHCIITFVTFGLPYGRVSRFLTFLYAIICHLI